MNRYVEPTRQLVTEIMVSDIERSIAFYQRLGFVLLRQDDSFAALTWEDHQLFLDQRPPSELAVQPVRFPPANIRVMVPNVDDYWRLVQDLGARIVAPIEDRSYGLRDFTIADPDGFGIRFASALEAQE